MPTETDLAYTAGIIDGEGCFAASNSSGDFRSPTGSRSAVMLVVAMNDEIVVPWLERTFGGRVNSGQGQHHNTFRWRLSGPALLEFLLHLRPYLRLKQEQADLCIAFLQTSGPRSGRGHKTPDDVLLLRSMLVDAIQEKNQRWKRVV